MKIIIYLLSLMVCTWAMPSSRPDIDWTKIKSKNVFVEPLINIEPEPGVRVIGGSEAEPHSIPYQVAVFADASSLCGGSLISPEWVLTAAHCTLGASYAIVILGAHDIRKQEDTQVVLNTTDITIHPDYDEVTVNNDVSLIRLPSPVALNTAIQVISIATASSGLFENSTAVLSGWGLTSDDSVNAAETLQRVNLTVIGNEDCASVFGPYIIDSTICTAGTNHVGSCHGDSGGPLVVDNVQVGVVSFGSGLGCEESLPSAYARVSSFNDWINSVISSSSS